ncbi:MAG: toprim domain-containing protein [Paracoccaceae bacterium]
MSAEARLSIEEIVDQLTLRIEDLARRLLPGGRKRGNEWVEASSARGGLGDSLSVRLSGGRAGVWCHFGGAGRGDALDLIAYVETGGDKVAAIKWAKDFLGIADGGGGASRPDPEALERARKARLKREQQDVQDRNRRSAHAQRLWLSAPVVEASDPVGRYLAGRGIGLPRLGRRPGCLRAGQLVRHRNGGDWPAMLAAIIDHEGRHVATHRTFLTAEGAKAPVDPVKMVLGDYGGGHIPVWKGQHRQTLRELPEGVPVYAAEGIEDALSAAVLRPDARIIAGVSVSNLGMLWLPDQCRELVLIAQNDPPDSPAAEAFDRVVRAHGRRGRTVRVARPPEGIKDFNDWIRILRGEV